MVSKEQFKNFWYYHKFHVLAGVFAAIFIVLTVSECAKNKEPDISIGYISSTYREHLKFEDELEKAVGDINGDGVEYAFCDSVVLSDVPQSDQDLMLIQKVSVMFASRDYDVFIMDKDFFEADVYGDMFVDLSDVLPAHMAEDAVKMRGKPMAVKTTHCKFLNDLSFSGDDLYVGFSALRLSDEGKEKYETRHNALKKVFDDIILGMK